MGKITLTEKEIEMDQGQEEIMFYESCKDLHLEEYREELLNREKELPTEENEQEAFRRFEELLKNNPISIGFHGFGFSETTFDFKTHCWQYNSLSYRHHFGKRLDDKEKRVFKKGSIPLKAEKEFASRLYFLYKFKKGHYCYESHCCDATDTDAHVGETSFSWVPFTTFGLAFNSKSHTDGCRDHNDNQTGKATKKWLENTLYSELFDQIKYAFDRLKSACVHPEEEYPEDAFELVYDFRQKAVEQYEKMAAEGNVQAIRHLAELYYHGVYLRKDKKYALELFNKAANGNDACALLMLADFYYDGVEVEQDFQKAATFYRRYLVKPKFRGNPDYAWYKLGLLYRDGKGVQKNGNRAALLFKMAARYGYKPAVWECIKCLYYGRGVKQNIPAASDLAINRATWRQQQMFVQMVEAETTPFDAERLFGLGCLLKMMLTHRPWEEDKYTDEEKETIYKANQMIYKAAESGLTKAEEKVAYIIGRGGGEIGLPKDENKAVELYIKAANQGSDDAKLELISFYLNGTFELLKTKRNSISVEKARYWFNQMSIEKQKEHASLAKRISNAMYRKKKKKG